MKKHGFMLKTTYEGEEILHRLLWHIVEEESERAAMLARGWFNPSAVAMVFAFHTIEAYLNYVGERLAPDIWKQERNYFRREPYRGWEGKLRKVLELAGLTWNPGERPLSTVLQLRQLRDLLAHGKPEKLEGEFLHPAGTESPTPVSTLRKMIVPQEKLQTVLSDVEQFLCQIHSLAKPKVKANDNFFGGHPLQGTSEYSVHSTTIHSDKKPEM